MSDETAGGDQSFGRQAAEGKKNETARTARSGPFGSRSDYFGWPFLAASVANRFCASANPGGATLALPDPFTSAP